jgi:hypothetical protein
MIVGQQLMLLGQGEDLLKEGLRDIPGQQPGSS